jgi:hypothetical protein
MATAIGFFFLLSFVFFSPLLLVFRVEAHLGDPQGRSMSRQPAAKVFLSVDLKMATRGLAPALGDLGGLAKQIN